MPLTPIGLIGSNCTVVELTEDDSIAALTIFYDSQIRAILIQTEQRQFFQGAISSFNLSK